MIDPVPRDRLQEDPKSAPPLPIEARFESRVELKRSSWEEWLKMPPPPALAELDEKEELLISKDWDKEEDEAQEARRDDADDAAPNEVRVKGRVEKELWGCDDDDDEEQRSKKAAPPCTPALFWEKLHPSTRVRAFETWMAPPCNPALLFTKEQELRLTRKRASDEGW